jgi:L-fuculose-phosphate aldolase
MDELVYRQFRDVGHDLFLCGLISSHGGNLSVRVGDRLVIKRRGTMLGRLRLADLVETGLFEDDEGTPLASTELIVHRAIYRTTSALAVVHAHPRITVALSLFRDEIIPLDSEGGLLLGRVPVVTARVPSGSPEVAEAVAQALAKQPVVVVRRHGSFAIGQTLEEAFQRTAVLEEACEIIWRAALLGESSKS